MRLPPPQGAECCGCRISLVGRASIPMAFAARTTELAIRMVLTPSPTWILWSRPPVRDSASSVRPGELVQISVALVGRHLLELVQRGRSGSAVPR